MGLRFKDQGYGECFFVTTSFRNHAKHGEIKGVYEALCDSLSHYLIGYGARLAGYVLMSSHLHLLIVLSGSDLGRIVRDFKKYTAQESLPACGIRAASVWQSRYDRVLVQSESVFRTKLDYIHANPVRAGLSTLAEEWPWSSAVDYLGERAGPVPVWKDWLF